MFWTPRQRLALSLILLFTLLYLLLRHRLNPSHIPNPQPSSSPRSTQLQDKIDPNTATATDLAALPSIGPAMARRILEDRDQFQKDHPHQPPYRQLKDLQRIKGIGPATLENLKPYLRFPLPSRIPDTVPSTPSSHTRSSHKTFLLAWVFTSST